MNTTKDLNQAITPTINLLKVTYGIVPIVAGLDKFLNLLTNWEQYLHPGLTQMTSFTPTTIMMIVGMIEVIAGIVVFIRPVIGGIVVASWLTLVAVTLLFSGHYLDVAVRDLVMAIGAFSLARLVIATGPKVTKAS